MSRENGSFMLSKHGLRWVTPSIALLWLLITNVCAFGQVIEQGWQFTPDPQGQYTAAEVDGAGKWRPDRASLSWNAQFEDLRDYAGVGWYRVSVNLPQPQASRRELLHFGAVDYFTEVWINGRRLGQHEGGYTPFTFDLTGDVHAGSNEILVRVFDPPPVPMPRRQSSNASDAARVDSFHYNEIPHGKQNWYVQTSGIWQPVSLEAAPLRYVEWVHVTPHNSGDVAIEAGMSGSRSAAPLHATVFDPYGKAVAELTLAASWSENGGKAQGQTHVANPMLWDGGHPNLYSVDVTQPGQRVHTRFGFREFTTANGSIYLNGRRFYLRAALDQDFYPVGIYTPPSTQFIRDEMLLAKSMGLNMLRCHIKVPDPRYLEAADETGMLVWYEIPVWNDGHDWTPQAAQRGVDTFRAEVQRDWNHPSIVIQSIMNEQWGMDETHANQRAWLLHQFQQFKQLTAPLGRLIVDDSACCSGFHLHTDFADWHSYFSIPDHAEDWAAWVRELATRPKWLFSPYGDAVSTGQEPLLVSEFGNWGLPPLPPRAQLPWWFPRDFNGRAITRPAGVFDRLREYGLDRIFSDYSAVALATEKHQYLALKYEIEQMRRQDKIQGYVITEFTDVNWEANGLVNMWRQPKTFSHDLKALQQDDELMADFATHNFTSGSNLKLPLFLSHYSGADLRGASIAWQTSSGLSGVLPLAQAPPTGGVAGEGWLEYKAALVQSPTPDYLDLQLRNGQGKILAHNHYRYAVYPQTSAAPSLSVRLHDPRQRLSGLRAALLAHGLGVRDDGEGDVWICSVLDGAAKSQLSRGGAVLLIANGSDALPKGGSLSIVPRADSDLSGDWVSNFNWVDSSSAVWRPLSPVIEDSILGWEAASVIPRFVIAGLPQADFRHADAGVFYGWLNQNRAYLAELRQGSGRLLLTTFRFDDYGRDPFTTLLLDQILKTAAEPIR